MTRTEPTAWLCPPPYGQRLEYVPSEHTDIRQLFDRIRSAEYQLAAIQSAQSEEWEQDE